MGKNNLGRNLLKHICVSVHFVKTDLSFSSPSILEHIGAYWSISYSYFSKHQSPPRMLTEQRQKDIIF